MLLGCAAIVLWMVVKKMENGGVFALYFCRMVSQKARSISRIDAGNKNHVEESPKDLDCTNFELDG